MIPLLNFIVSFALSFVGTIPPGTLNLSILQLGLANRIGAAWRFALAAALVEYPYAWLAVRFERAIVSTPTIAENIQLIAAVVMLLLGIFNLWSARHPSGFSERFNNSGFRRGLVLGILNPLALPFWLGGTAYLNSQHWIQLDTPFRLHCYLAGVSTGALALLMSLAFLVRYVVQFLKNNDRLFKVIPGMILLALGIYALIQYVTG